MRTKHTHHFSSIFRLPHWMRLTTFGAVCTLAAFVVGIETAGDVHPVDRSQAAVQDESAFRVPVKGDLDDNGELTVDDAILLLEFIEKSESPTAVQRTLGDIDGDFSLTSRDLLRLLHTISLH